MNNTIEFAQLEAILSDLRDGEEIRIRQEGKNVVISIYPPKIVRRLNFGK